MKCKICEREFTPRYQYIANLGWCLPCRKSFNKYRFSYKISLRPCSFAHDEARADKQWATLHAMTWAADRARRAKP